MKLVAIANNESSLKCIVILGQCMFHVDILYKKYVLVEITSVNDVHLLTCMYIYKMYMYIHVSICRYIRLENIH